MEAPFECEESFNPYVDDPLLTPDEAAEYCKVSVATVNTWRREGRLPAVKAIADARFRRSDLNRFIKKNLIWGRMEGPTA